MVVIRRADDGEEHKSGPESVALLRRLGGASTSSSGTEDSNGDDMTEQTDPDEDDEDEDEDEDEDLQYAVL